MLLPTIMTLLCTHLRRWFPSVRAATAPARQLLRTPPSPQVFSRHRKSLRFEPLLKSPTQVWTSHRRVSLGVGQCRASAGLFALRLSEEGCAWWSFFLVVGGGWGGSLDNVRSIPMRLASHLADGWLYLGCFVFFLVNVQQRVGQRKSCCDSAPWPCLAHPG